MNRYFIICVFTFFIGFAQNPYSIHYSLEEGLPTSNVYSAFEDHQGYMWFSTDVGVLRFDGYNFKHYNTDDGLGDNEVFRIFEDSKKRLWFLSLNGKLSYFKNNQFFNAKNSEALSKASHQKMLIDIFEDTTGNLHFLYRDGKVITTNTSLHILEVYQNDYATNAIWKNGQSMYTLTNRSIKNIETNEEIMFSNTMLSLNGYRYYLDGEHFYFSSKNTIYEFKENDFAKVFQLKNSEIIFITKIDGAFWIGTRNGLYVKKGSGLITYFEGNIVSSVIKDSEGGFWLTTLNNGIKYIPNFNLKSHEFDTDNIKVNTIEKDNNTLWIGTNKGLYSYDNASVIDPVSKADYYVKRIRNYNNTIFSIGNDSITIFKADKHKSLSFGANDILIDETKYILASSVVFQFEQGALNQIDKDFSDVSFKALEDYKVFGKRTNVSVKKDELVYFGTSTGLYTYTNNSIEKVPSLNDELNTSILDIFVDEPSKRTLIATNSKGLTILNDNGEIDNISSLQGLNSNGCNAVKKISNDSYFIGTNRGLNKITFKDTIVDVIDFNTVLNINAERINDIELIGENVYLASDKGLLSFNYSKVAKHKRSKPKLIIENIDVNSKAISDLSNLSHTDNSITINYTGISFSDFGNLIYEYKFNKDLDWATIQNRQLDFKNLSNGKYDLHIRAKGKDKLYSDIKHITFTIKPPFWQTLPFVFLVLALFFLTTLFLVKQRLKTMQSRFALERKSLKALQEKALLEKQMIDLEQKALRLQMNPHFIFNGLNTIKGYYSGGDIDKANTYISKFSKLLRLILENDQHLVELEKEIEILEMYIKLIQLRYQDVFDYNIGVSDDLLKDEIGVPPLLFQPIVENAIIHGLAPDSKKGCLEIVFKQENNQLVCSIKDNGVGFTTSSSNKNRNHQSKALNITRERINFLNNTTDSENFKIINLKNPSGTEVILKVPLTNLWT